ncbi:hypothetical protein GCM10020255_038800 [Rhodococcus baikonurensis]
MRGRGSARSASTASAINGGPAMNPASAMVGILSAPIATKYAYTLSDKESITNPHPRNVSGTRISATALGPMTISKTIAIRTKSVIGYITATRNPSDPVGPV